jgi:hypothetical protein
MGTPPGNRRKRTDHYGRPASAPLRRHVCQDDAVAIRRAAQLLTDRRGPRAGVADLASRPSCRSGVNIDLTSLIGLARMPSRRCDNRCEQHGEPSYHTVPHTAASELKKSDTTKGGVGHRA